MPESPAVARWELMLRVRERAREHGVKASTIHKALEISAPYWSQVANYKGVLGEDKLETLIALLDFDAADRDELLALRGVAKSRNPFAEFSALFNETLMRYHGLEAGAQSIRGFEHGVIPGLLQTEDYIRALMQENVTIGRPTDVEPRVRARLLRQRRLDAPDSLHLSVVMSQAALMYVVGGPEVHRSQLEHLRTAIHQRPETLDIRVIPFESGSAIAGLNAATFQLLNFASSRLPTIGWVENAVQAEITEDAETVNELNYLYKQMQMIALDRTDSEVLIGEISRRVR